MRIIKTTPFNYAGEPGATSIHLVWRMAVLHAMTIATWNWNTTRVEVEDNYVSVGRAMEGLRQITADQAAAYVTSSLPA